MQNKRDSVEARDALEKYFTGNASAYYKGDNSKTSEFIRMFCKGKLEFIDSPDFVVSEGNNVLIVEHFEFDDYKSAMNGSKNRIEQARIDRIAEAITPTEEGAMYHDQINGESSLRNYELNAISQFNKHYEKIQKYKERIKQLGISNDDSKVEVAFLIEDKSPLGTLVHDGNNTLSVALAHDKSFLEFYKNRPNVDYVINCFSAFNQCTIWIIPYSQLDLYEKDILHYEQMQFISTTPQVIGFNTLIPKNKKV